jgi:hypothetical protein
LIEEGIEGQEGYGDMKRSRDLTRRVIGFTGDETFPTQRQLNRLQALLCCDDELHHGDCVGSDAAAHDIGTSLGCKLVIHPPDNPRKRAFCNGPFILDPKPYLVRNMDIVRVCDELIALSSTNWERLRSGTWATIRYARRMGKPVTIITPSGRLFNGFGSNPTRYDNSSLNNSGSNENGDRT